ncbi:Protein of unknown function [Paracidovorax valerianellae]|uniref:SPOR domain-containing protein n=1 Tax=Paracidovorax valerianellae TaxID=187868 RepID=A0A1G6NQS4_9BURK|nr:SPOR domain-containing protein [Paracidovorax valerianellae]SDC70109.1 Protein of unknown function [Paracidovorax valerianellae]
MLAHTAYAAHAPIAPRRSDDSTIGALYRAAIGPINTDHYLPAFERLDTAGRALPRWNWAAALFTLNWLVFRQLWGAALVYVAALEGVALLVFALGKYVVQWPLPVLAGVLLAFLLAATVVPGLYGDAIFHADVRKRITKALSASATLPQAGEWLARHAATQRRLGWIVGANVALAVAALVAYLLFPAGASFASLTGNDSPAAAAATTSAASTASAGSVAVPAPAADTPASADARSAVLADPSSAPASSSAPAASATPASAPAPVPAAPVAALANRASAPSAIPIPASTPAAPARMAASQNATPSVHSTTASAAAPAPTNPVAATAVPTPTPAASRAQTASQAQPPASRPAPASRPVAESPKSPASAAKPAASRAATAPVAAAEKASAASSTAGAASAPTADRRLYINVGLFADPANAQRAHARLRKAGLPAMSQPITTSSGQKLQRVRVGPFASASQANAAAAQVRELGLDASAAAQPIPAKD